MSLKTVEDLPEEILEQIFKLLPQETLKEVALTCKTWKQLVEQAVTWSAVLRHENACTVDAGTRVELEEYWMESVLASKRKISKLKLDGALDLSKNRTMEVLSLHGTHIKELLLFCCVFEKPNEFVEMIAMFPNLTKVIFSETLMCASKEDFADESRLPELRFLKTIEASQTEYEVLGAFKKARITTFKALSTANLNNKPFSTSIEFLIEFLASQKNIETLALRSFDLEEGHMFSSSLSADIAQLREAFPFQLKRLSLLGMNLNKTPNEYNTLLQFIKKQTQLEELELGRKFPEFVYEFVLSQLKRLKTLRVDGNDLPSSMDVYERLEENRSVTNLVVTNGYSESQHVIELIRRMPNIQSLKFSEDCDRDITEFIAGFLRNLKHLSLTNGNGELLDGLRFHSLSSLHLRNLDEAIDWESFTRDNPSVVALKINIVFAPIANFEAIPRNWKLQSLILSNGVECTPVFLNAIRNNCSDLKRLEISAEDATVSLADTADIRNFRFLTYECPPFNMTESEFWRDDDYRFLPSDDFNWRNILDPDEMDPFEMGLMMEDLLHELGIDQGDDDDDYDPDDDYDDYDDFD